MKNYLWLFVLGIIASISLVLFMLTISRDSYLIKKLNLSKYKLLLNIVLLIGTVIDLSLIIYLFMTVKSQLEMMTL